MNVFDVIPSGFFNNLASGSNQRIYADCIQLVYAEYEREVSYRIQRNRIRDALSLYFLENHVELKDEDGLGDKSANDMAGAVIRKFSSKEVGWLEEEIDDTTYEKQIIMTESGIALAEFLNLLKKPEKEEFTSYIYNIYNTLNNPEQWKGNPYVAGVKHINRNAKALSKALKKLSTFIRKIIEKMVNEQTLESLTENIIEYLDGDFIREYSRLVKQQNIHIYRRNIKQELDRIGSDEELIESIIQSCLQEENLDYEEAAEYVEEMLQSTKRFLIEDYDRIMKDIKHKINVYLSVAVGRARFIRSRETDIRGNVERTIRYIIEEMEEFSMKDVMPEEIDLLFKMNRHEFIDTGSIRFPRKNITIKKAVVQELEVISDEDIEKARMQQEREAYNPYSKDMMKTYLLKCFENRTELTCDDLPMSTKGDLLANLSAIAYAKENGFEVEVLDGYYEANNMLLRRFKVTQEEEE